MKPLVLVSVVALVAFSGCRPKSKPEPPPPTTTTATVAQSTTATTATDSPDAGQPAKAEPDSGSAAAGPPCIDDEGCREYLRCEAGHCVVPPAIDGRIVEGMPTATFSDGSKELAKIMLEIADSRAERQRGLMFRRKMHPDFGMLFIFDNDELRSFWMKNTLIPLDMVHIDSRGEVVGVVERAEPMTLSPRDTGEPARYVLELVAGRAAELGIKAGVKMKLDGLPPEQVESE